MTIHHERREVTPPHGDVMRVDVRRPRGPVPSGPSVILMAHGFKGFKDWGFFPYVSERLAADGHVVVSFNFSLNGVGSDLLNFTDLESFGRNTLSREVDDASWMVDAALDGVWTQGARPGSVGVLGHSRGGGVGIVVAARHGGVSSLVTWAAVSTFLRWSDSHVEDWVTRGVTYITNARTGQEMPLNRSLWQDLNDNRERLDVTLAAARVRAPWLIVHGSEDPTVPVNEARRLHAASPGASLRILEGSGHAFDVEHPMTASSAVLEEAILATLRHYSAMLA